MIFANSTWALGVLSWFVILLLPGLLAMRAVTVTLTRLHFMLLTVALSLLINFWLVLLLTVAQLYLVPIVRVIVAAELIAVILLYRHQLKRFVCLKPVASFWADSYRDLKADPAGSLWYRLAIFIIAIGFIAYFAIVWLLSFGTIFQPWDPAVSWNLWAVSWTLNHLPFFTHYYPQLVPANWSISYMLVGSANGSMHLQAFPRFIMGAFPLLLVACLLVLYQYSRNIGYLLAVVLVSLLLVVMYDQYLVHGYVDIALATLVLLALTHLIIANCDSDHGFTHILLGTLVVATAALVKQAGLWLALVYPLLSYVMYWRRLATVASIWPIIIGQWLLLAMLILPWYVLAHWLMTLQLNDSALHYLTSTIYSNNSISQHLILAWQQGSIFYWLLFLGAIIFSWRLEQWRWPLWLVALPMTIIWLFWFDYDARNLASCVPIVATAAALLIYQASSKQGWLQHAIVAIGVGSQRLRVYELLLFCIMAVVLLGYQDGFKAHNLNARQQQQQAHIANPKVDHKLYQTLHNSGFDGTILTAWPFLAQLPDVGAYAEPLDHELFGPDMMPNIFMSVANLKQAIASDQSIHYLLVYSHPRLLAPAVASYIHRQVKQGHYQQLWHVDDFAFYTIQDKETN